MNDERSNVKNSNGPRPGEGESQDRPLECICAGHVCLDVIPSFPAKENVEVKELLSPGNLVVIGAAKLAPGGPVSNVGIALHKLGVKTAFMGKVGDDLFGKGLLELFKPFGAERGMVVVPGEVTSYTLVIAPPGVDRIFLHNPGANDTYCAADIDSGPLAETLIFHLGYPPLMRRLYEDGGRELAAIFRRAKEAGATTSLDLALPDPSSEAGKVDWRSILTAVLPYVDIFLPSCEELMFMFDRERFTELRRQAAGRDPVVVYTGEDFRRLAVQSLSLGAGILVLKSGQRGIYLAGGASERLSSFGRAKPGTEEFADRELWQAAYRVEPIASATGSGDSAIAGFLAAFLLGLGPEACLHTAAAVGADNLTVLDATSGIRSWDETADGIAGLSELDPDTGEGFVYDETLRIWRGPHDGKGVR